MPKSASSNRNAFTLIELLVVISIIAILLGLLIPGVGSVMDNARKTQAKNDLANIVTAISAYETEYGKLPGLTGDAGDQQLTETAELFKTLTAKESTNNPRQIAFIEIPAAKNNKLGTNSSGQWMDPWGNKYEIKLDGDYDNVLKGPDGNEVGKKVIAWSTGKPKSANEPNSDVKKYVKSWE